MTMVCAASLGAACDGTGKVGVDGTSCGPGTHEVNGECVLDGADDTDGATGADTDGGTTDSDGDTDSNATDGATTVCSDGTADWADLQDAVDAAHDGDTLALCPGDYDYVQLSGRTLTIVGTAGRAQTRILGVQAHPAILVETGSLTLSGVTLTGVVAQQSAIAAIQATSATVEFKHGAVAGVVGSALEGTLIGSYDSNLTLADVRVEDNTLRGAALSVDGGAVRLTHTVWTRNRAVDAIAPTIAYITKSVIVMENNLIYDNDLGYHGVRVMELLAGSTISNNTWHGDARVSGPATHPFEVDLNSNVVFTNNIVGPSTNCSGIRSFTSAPSNLTYNLSYGHDSGVDFSSDFSALHNVAVDPLFVDAAHGDFHLAAGSPARNLGNPSPSFDDPDGSRSDLGAFGGPGGQW